MKGWLFNLKKIIILISLLVISFFILKEDYYIIPNEAIRFRVISSTNNSNDIIMKQKTAKELISILETFNTTSIEETRKSIVKNLETIENSISILFKENNYDETFIIRYGLNEFPEKIYKGVKYNAGLYESLVIEIGEAKGNNYWCVLYPPLCLLDEETEKVKYKSKVIELFKKYF